MTENKRNLLQVGLFLLTLVTTTLAGAEWQWGRYLFYGNVTLSWQDFKEALNFSIPFLLILTFHEFGHYFTAKHHGIKVSFPYYIPFWLGFIGAPSLGTMGAFIRIRETIKSRTHYFDVGVSGPLVGFVIALGVLWYGFASLPETEYIYEVHPTYELFGENFEEAMVGLDTVLFKSDLNPERYQYELYGDTIHIGSGSFSFGNNILMHLGRKYIAPKDRYIPSSKEIMHYPWLLAGYLALFFTALNLLPIGQLDGGHVVYGLFGAVWHKRISTVLFTCFLFYAGLGWVTMSDMASGSTEDALGFLFQVGIYLYILYLCTYSMFPQKRDRWMYAAIMLAVQFFLSSFSGWEGYNGWIFFGVLLGRFVGIQHPTTADDSPLSANRKIVGWIALIVFALCFSPQPIVIDV